LSLAREKRANEVWAAESVLMLVLLCVVSAFSATLRWIIGSICAPQRRGARRGGAERISA